MTLRADLEAAYDADDGLPEEEFRTADFWHRTVAAVQSWLETPEVAEAIYGALTGTGDGPPLHAIVHALQRAAEKGLT